MEREDCKDLKLYLERYSIVSREFLGDIASLLNIILARVAELFCWCDEAVEAVCTWTQSIGDK